MSERTFYLAGPMSGIPQFNFPAFYAATERLRRSGLMIISPAELDDQEDKGAAMSSTDGDPDNRDTMGGKTWADFLARDVKLIADRVQGIIFLPGWQRSRGARLEAFVGLLQKDFEFYEYTAQENRPLPDLMPVSEAAVMRDIVKHTTGSTVAA